MTLPDYVTWDPQMLTTSGRQPVQNNGCPEGYFAQFVGIGEPGSIEVPGRGYAIRCRLMATTTPATIVEESGTTTSEALAIYTEAVNDTARQISGAVSFGLPWVALGLAALAAMFLLPRRG